MALSPFRYPGAKRRLLHHFLDELLEGSPSSFSDLFVGGGSVLLTVASALPKTQLYANDLHQDIAAFWCVVSRGGHELEELLERVRHTSPSLEQFYELKESVPLSDTDRAFKVLFLNRCSFSGIGVNPIGGKLQKSQYSVGCRWNASKLVQSIEAAHLLLDGRTSVSNLDACEAPWAERVYLDPPYIRQGSILYSPDKKEAGLGGQDLHPRLAAYLQTRSGWVLSYDIDALPLYEWATVRHIQASYSITGKNRANWKGNGRELIITP